MEIGGSLLIFGIGGMAIMVAFRSICSLLILIGVDRSQYVEDVWDGFLVEAVLLGLLAACGLLISGISYYIQMPGGLL